MISIFDVNDGVSNSSNRVVLPCLAQGVNIWISFSPDSINAFAVHLATIVAIRLQYSHGRRRYPLPSLLSDALATVGTPCEA